MTIRQVYFDLNGTLFDPSVMAKPIGGEGADRVVEQILDERRSAPSILEGFCLRADRITFPRLRRPDEHTVVGRLKAPHVHGDDSLRRASPDDSARRIDLLDRGGDVQALRLSAEHRADLKRTLGLRTGDVWLPRGPGGTLVWMLQTVSIGALMRISSRVITGASC